MEEVTFKSIMDYIGIDYTVVLLYVCSGLLVKAYLSGAFRIPFTKLDVTIAWRTLLLGTVIVGVYVFIEYKWPSEFDRATLKKLFISYIFTTSFYELILKETIVKWIVNLLNKLKPKDPINQNQNQ